MPTFLPAVKVRVCSEAAAAAAAEQQHQLEPQIQDIAPVLHGSGNPEEDGDGLSLTRANGAQVGRALPAFLRTGRCSGRCRSRTSVLPGSGNVCVRLSGVERTLSGGESAQLPTRLSPSANNFSRRRLQPAAPTAVRSLSPRFLFPDDRRQIIGPPHSLTHSLTHPPAPLRIRAGTRRHDPSSQQEPPDSARRRSRSANAPINCSQHAETRRCIGHPGRWC